MKKLLLGVMFSILTLGVHASDGKMIAGINCDAGNADRIDDFEKEIDGRITNISGSTARVVCPMLNDYYGEKTLNSADIYLHSSSTNSISCTVMVANPVTGAKGSKTLSTTAGYSGAHVLKFPSIGNGNTYNNYVAYCDLGNDQSVLNILYVE